MTRLITSVFAVVCLVSFASAVPPTDSQESLENVNTCGVSQVTTGFIHHGAGFKRGTYPWLVAMMLKTNYTTPQFFCGGTIISSNFVLTAAHCIHWKGTSYQLTPPEILAVMGVIDLTQLFDREKLVLRPKSIVVHEDWDANDAKYDADVALLEFEQGQIMFSKFIQPICYWTSTEDPAATEGTIAGWGKSHDLSKPHEEIAKSATVKIMTNVDCFYKYKDLLPLSSNRTFCAGLQNGTGVCTGDSGGGLIMNVGGINYLRGIVSAGIIKDSNCDVYTNAVYTDVLKFTEWITEKTNGAFAIYRPPIKKVKCEVKEGDSWIDDKPIQFCKMKKVINTEFHIMGSDIDTTVQGFYLHDELETKYLPKYIGQKLPELQEVAVHGTGLTIVRDYYFKNLKKLRFLTLYANNIAVVEPEAFTDLANVEELRLQHNRIGSLDEKIFSTMIKLKKIYLNNNSLKILMPTTFVIPDGSLNTVNLDSNGCIDKYYNVNNIYRLEADLGVKCAIQEKP